jgi:hypothetical protein
MTRHDLLGKSARRVAVLAAALLVTVSSVSAAEQAVEPFNGKDLTGWKLRGNEKQSKWTVGTAKLKADNPAAIEVTPGGHELINAASHSCDIYTAAKFGDVAVEIDILVPKGSNSGVYLMGEYEIQVLDSFGKKNVGPGDMGGVYHTAAPKVNASKAPGEWQKLTVDFRAPKFDAQGKKTANARMVKITLNDQLIHENVDVPAPTGGQLGPETATGPLMLQGDHGPVSFRNIKITPLAAGK